MIFTLLAVSVVAFIIIQLPPGDYLTSYIMKLQSSGTHVSQEEVAALKKQYGLDLPIYARYFKWMWGMFPGNIDSSGSFCFCILPGDPDKTFFKIYILGPDQTQFPDSHSGCIEKADYELIPDIINTTP